MSRHKQSVVKRLKRVKTTGCSLVGKDHQYHSSFGGLGWAVVVCRLAHLASQAVSSNWKAIDLARCTDSHQRFPQIGRHISAGQPRDRWARAAGETRDGAGEHVSSPHVMCMSVQTFFFSVFCISFFWCCLWFPCHPGLLVPTMHDRERQPIISLLLTAFTLYVNNLLFF